MTRTLRVLERFRGVWAGRASCSSILRTDSINSLCQSAVIDRGAGPAPETSEIWPPFQFTISLNAATPSLPGAVAWRTCPPSK